MDDTEVIEGIEALEGIEGIDDIAGILSSRDFYVSFSKRIILT